MTDTIVLLHGGATGSSSWNPVACALVSSGASVFAPDMLGYGASPPPTGSYGIPEEVARGREESARRGASPMAPPGRSGARRRAMTPLRESMELSRPAAEERWEAALAPDTVLASQLGDEPLAAAQLQPEKRLQLAVLVPVLTQPWTPELGLDARRRSVPTDDAAHGSASGRGVGYICPTLQLTRTCSI